MITDTSAASALAKFICVSFCEYIDALLKAIGIRRRITAVANENDVNSWNKINRIETCLGTTDSIDLWELRELALSDGGLLQGT